MYGHELPRYVREYEQDIQHYDRFLRLRWSLDSPGLFLVERKTRYLTFPDVPRMTDRAVQYSEGYRPVLLVKPSELRFVRRSLELTDVQRYGGAKVLADRLDEADERERELVDRAIYSNFEDLSGEAYDWLAWREGRRVALRG